MEAPAPRLTSLDALRGLDMLIILGIDALVYALYPLSGGGAAATFIREQMGHAPWEGLRMYDCVFPLFVFMAGISMCFSQLRRYDIPIGRNLIKLWKRALVLVLLGMLVNGNISWDLSQMRCASVLGLIGLSGALAGSTTLIISHRIVPNLIIAALLLAGVGMAQYLGGDMTPSGCFNAKVDAQLCPGVLYSGSYDPEGPLCIISGTALCLLGYCGGRLFLQINSAGLRVITMLGSGLLLLASGWWLPCIKGIWTPGFVLCSAGICAVLMAVFHLFIDVFRLGKWVLPLSVVGMNALAIYVLTHIVSFQALAARALGGTWSLFLSPEWQKVAHAAAALLLAWWLCWFLHRKRVYIKI